MEDVKRTLAQHYLAILQTKPRLTEVRVCAWTGCLRLIIVACFAECAYWTPDASRGTLQTHSPQIPRHDCQFETVLPQTLFRLLQIQ